MPDDAPTDGSTGEDDVWSDDDPSSAEADGGSDGVRSEAAVDVDAESDADAGAGAGADEDPDGPGAAGGDDDDRLPSAVGGSRGRMIVGLVILLFGIAVAVAAVSQRGSDERATPAGRDEPTAEGTDAAAAAPTSTTEAVRTPTTLPGGVLPTGCGDWDATFGFEPEPIDGVAVWSDFDGWHIRVGPEGPEVVTGTVTGQVVPVLGNQFRPAGVDVSADPATATVVFSITRAEEPVGFDFAADCAQKQLSFQLWGPDGEPLPVDQVQVGRNGTTVEMPFHAQRTMAAG